MKDKELSGPNKSHHDASGLVSASDMSMPCPEQGWGGVDNVPGVDPGMTPPIRSSVDRGFSPSGEMVGGPGPNVGMDGNDIEVPLTTLLDVGEQPGEKTGAGLRTAVGTSFNG
jgi:hypothetical protein